MRETRAEGGRRAPACGCAAPRAKGLSARSHALARAACTGAPVWVQFDSVEALAAQLAAAAAAISLLRARELAARRRFCVLMAAHRKAE